MKKSISHYWLAFLIIFFASPLFGKEDSIFQQRRQKILDSMPENSLLILTQDDENYRFGFNFRQNSDLYYLTGSQEQGITLILATTPISLSNGKLLAKSFLLYFYRPAKMKTEKYQDSLIHEYKVDFAASTTKLRRILNKIEQLNVFYTNLKPRDGQFTSGILARRLNQFLKRFPDAKIKPSWNLTAPLRRIKSEEEIRNIQKAVEITVQAQKEAMRCMKPGLYEHQIEALVEFVFKYNGAEQLAFPTIVGAGPNSLILHYDEGKRKIQPGDMVVMDIGCEYNHYCADITRTIPATGKFTPAQKKVYQIVLEANKAVIDSLKPGMTIKDMDSIVENIFKKYNFEKYIRHSCSHELGLDVHDVGSRSKPLEPGCVVTVEPGIYIPENSDLPQEYWNIGIRIEDDVLITENGHQLLSGGIVKTIEGIEKLMSKQGILDKIFTEKTE